MTVSIIIPVYNTPSEKLTRCLDSVLSQIFTDWECLVVDDGSTNSAASILDGYAKKDSRFIAIHKENGGVSSARNKGLEVARGKWVVFVDSDDYLLPEHLRQMMQTTFGDIDMVMTGYKKITNEKTTEHRYSKKIYIGKKSIGSFIEETDFLEHQQPWDRMYRNKGEVRFDERLSLSEDRLFCYHYLMNCKGIATIDAITYIHDVSDESSLSYRKYPSSMNEYRYTIFKRINNDLAKRYSLTSEYTRFFFNDYMEGIYACLINAYLDEGNKLMYHLTRILYRLKLK